jgi:outer membrane immunogenic protein
MTFRNLIAALGLLSLGTAGAMAADMPLKAPMAPPPPPSWTGFYIGINGGASWATAANSINLGGLGLGGAATLPLYSQGLNGFLGGGQIGYNYQSGNFLVGVEGDGDWSNARAPRLASLSSPAPPICSGPPMPPSAPAFCRCITCSSTSRAARRGPV